MQHGRSVRKKLSNLEDKLAWLRDRPDLWQSVKLVSLPGGSYRLFSPLDDSRRIVKAMKEAKLLAPTTNYLDVRVGKYIRLLRGLR